MNHITFNNNNMNQVNNNMNMNMNNMNNMNNNNQQIVYLNTIPKEVPVYNQMNTMNNNLNMNQSTAPATYTIIQQQPQPQVQSQQFIQSQQSQQYQQYQVPTSTTMTSTMSQSQPQSMGNMTSQQNQFNGNMSMNMSNMNTMNNINNINNMNNNSMCNQSMNMNSNMNSVCNQRPQSMAPQRFTLIQSSGGNAFGALSPPAVSVGPLQNIPPPIQIHAQQTPQMNKFVYVNQQFSSSNSVATNTVNGSWNNHHQQQGAQTCCNNNACNHNHGGINNNNNVNFSMNHQQQPQQTMNNGTHRRQPFHSITVDPLPPTPGTVINGNHLSTISVNAPLENVPPSVLMAHGSSVNSDDSFETNPLRPHHPHLTPQSTLSNSTHSRSSHGTNLGINNSRSPIGSTNHLTPDDIQFDVDTCWPAPASSLTLSQRQQAGNMMNGTSPTSTKSKSKKNSGITYPCETCGRLFKHKSNLKTHRRIHDPDAPTCKYCGKKFARESNLKQHLRYDHLSFCC